MSQDINHPDYIDQDGATHINVYSRGATDLGKALSNFTRAPFVHPEFGQFASVEGFWYWLSAGHGEDREELRHRWGASAKATGSEIPSIPLDEEYFHNQIKVAIRCKIEQNPEIREMFINSSLPFDHYFVGYERELDRPKWRRWIMRKKKHRWQMEFLELLRKELQSQS